jgi:hypothetical protein
MPLEDYISPGRRWLVKKAGDSSMCKEGQEVIISGLPTEVNIECGTKSVYGLGWYDENTNTVKVMNDEYEIKLQITLTPKAGDSSGGSWTAEDQGPWPGDG